MRNSYSVTKVLLQELSIYSNTSSVRNGLIVLNRTSSTEIGIQTDIRRTTVASDEYSGTKKRTSSVNQKSKGSKETFSKDILEYLNSKDYLKSVLCCLPQKLLKRRNNNPDALYTVDRDVASKCRSKYWWRYRGSKAHRFILLFYRLLYHVSAELWQFLHSVVVFGVTVKGVIISLSKQHVKWLIFCPNMMYTVLASWNLRFSQQLRWWIFQDAVPYLPNCTALQHRRPKF
jgi:hypothetical protein